MARFRSLASRLSALLRRREWHTRVDEELEFHLRMETEENIRRGMDPSRARAAASRKLGNTTLVREEVRDMNTIEFLDETARNFRLALRTLRRNPGFALTAVLVLAFGLGASTAMFSALDRILFRPLPYPDGHQLVQIGMTVTDFGANANGGRGDVVFTDRAYLARWMTPPEPFESVTIVSRTPECDITEEQRPERVRCAYVRENFLETFRMRVALGRDFSAEDDVRGAPPVAIISHELWSRRFGGDHNAVGRKLNIGGQAVPIIGVLPPGFETPGGETADLWLPSQIFPIPPKSATMSSFIMAFGRLKPGVTPQQAEAAVAPLIEEEAKVLRRGRGGDYRPRVRSLRDYQVGNAARAAWLLLGAVAGLLLIACVNVTNLILARVAAREREFAVRSALGAGKWRLARLAMTESLLLSATAGALGLAIAAALLRLFVSLAPSSIFKLDEASLDLRVLAVAVTLAVIAGAAVGLWPAITILRTGTLQHGARATVARPRLRFVLVSAQIALTVAMLAGSALLLRSLWNLVNVPLGFESDRVVTMSVMLTAGRFPQEDQQHAFHETLLDRIRQLPGTVSATLSNAPAPTGLTVMAANISVDGQPRDPNRLHSSIRLRDATPGYFETFRIPVLKGRAFTDADRDSTEPPVLLSTTAAQILFPGKDPLGHSVQVLVTRPPTWSKVVGVVPDLRNTGLDKEPQPELYIARGRQYDAFSRPRTGNYAVRTSASLADATTFLKQAVADLDPHLPVTIKPLNEEVAKLTERPRFLAGLLSAFAGLALLLAAAGLYGVASYLVTQRTRDIGVRIALGAAPADISRQVLSEAGRWIAVGAIVGCALAWAATRAIEKQLYGVGSHDPLSWIAALGVLGIALLLAVLRPATRAARVDPMEAIRAE
jgi:putative ABC transport system permease protein